jgi:hypothetical protein
MAKKPDPMAEHRKRERTLARRLGRAPLTEITGIVDAGGPGGGKSQGEKLYTFTLELVAWRAGDGEIRREKLDVRKPITERELDRLMAKIQPDSMIRFKGRLLDDSGDGTPAAWLERILSTRPNDAELAAVAKRLQAPTVYQDSVFGKVKLDRRFDSYEASAKWNGKKIKFSIGAGKLDKNLEIAHAVWKDQAKWKERVDGYAVKKLLSLKNGGWLEDGEKPLTAEQFKKRMKLESISFYDGGSFAFWHDDGELFWGHSIQVSADLKRGPYDADIPG